MRGQEVYCHVPPGLPPLRGDADQLRRVLLNILENALKFTPPGGRIDLVASHTCEEYPAPGKSAEWVASSSGNSYVTLEIRDTGSGIPPAALPHVCERFYRADTSRTRQPAQTGGSGLGLAIAKELIEAHHGTITIHSQLATGTNVTIQLPAQPHIPAINSTEG
jgi:signal transduction histidine kinase